ncbi:MAG: DUF6687 family protein [Pyrinomonadaceae bacterium]
MSEARRPQPRPAISMNFQFYTAAIAGTPKLSVDGTVENAIHFSHWKGNETTASVKADTSTEIVLNVVASPSRNELTKGIDLVTNNHFDTDGVLSVWTMLNGERATRLSDKLIAGAEAGDFSEFSSVDGVRSSILIQGSDSPIDKSGSPIARQLAGEEVNDEARAYDLVLPHVEDLLTNTSKYEALWRPSWVRIERALNSFAKDASRVDEDAPPRLSVVMLAPEVFGPDGFDPSRDAAPFTAISYHARGELFLIATPLEKGWAYRIDYPYYSWADTVVRPKIVRRELNGLMNELNELESNSTGKWKVDSSELASAAKFSDENGKLAVSMLRADLVASHLRNGLVESTKAMTP